MGARGRRRSGGVHRGGMEAPVRIALALAAALASCGEIENPDLDAGSLQGRIVNGHAGGYVYAFGLPGSKASVDGDGGFALGNLPAGDLTLVVIDGADPIDGTRRGDLVPVVVQGAEATRIPDLDAAAMPLAGRVLALAVPAGGALPAAPRFTVTGTDQIEVPPGPTGLAPLDPLPPGSYELVAAMNGFLGVRMTLAVSSATVLLGVPFAADLNDPEPGCVSSGGCVNGLVCDVVEGDCEACLADPDCAAHGAGATCVEGHCTAAGGSKAGLVCAGCIGDPDCASGVCAYDGVSGFCSATCVTSADCPAGFACGTVGSRDVCVTPSGCDEYRERFGVPCSDDSSCAAALAGGTCRGAAPEADPPRPGTCTAPCDGALPGVCTVAASGYRCDAGSGYCASP